MVHVLVLHLESQPWFGICSCLSVMTCELCERFSDDISASVPLLQPSFSPRFGRVQTSSLEVMHAPLEALFTFQASRGTAMSRVSTNANAWHLVASALLLLVHAI